MATCIHSSRSCLPPFYTIPIFPLLNRKIFHLLVIIFNGWILCMRNCQYDVCLRRIRILSPPGSWGRAKQNALRQLPSKIWPRETTLGLRRGSKRFQNNCILNESRDACPSASSSALERSLCNIRTCRSHLC